MKSTKSAYCCMICLCMTGSIFFAACGQRAELPESAELPWDAANQTGMEEMKETVETEDTEEVSEPKSRALTQEEKEFFFDYLSSRENAGFLLSTYESAEGIDLNELFYSGAGMSDGSLTEEEAQDYLNASGDTEIYTDVVHLTTTEIDDFLLKKTGLTSAQMKRGLDWVYSAQTDTWYHQAGDINLRWFECVDGTVAGDIYTLHMQAVGSEDGYRAERYETVLKKNGDTYQFVSNLLSEDGKIEDQSFDITLDPWGEVSFVSYMPEENGLPNADVTFRVIQDGRILMTLDGVTYDNVRENRRFLSLDAVSFPDFDSDGHTDLIAIVSYASTGGADAGDSFAEARVYRGNEWGYFMYERDISEEVNAALEEFTVGNVRAYISAPK